MQQEAQQPEQKQQLNTQAQTAASATTPSTSSGSKKKRCEWLVGEEKCMARAAPIVVCDAQFTANYIHSIIFDHSFHYPLMMLLPRASAVTAARNSAASIDSQRHTAVLGWLAVTAKAWKRFFHSLSDLPLTVYAVCGQALVGKDGWGKSTKSLMIGSPSVKCQDIQVRNDFLILSLLISVFTKKNFHQSDQNIQVMHAIFPFDLHGIAAVHCAPFTEHSTTQPTNLLAG